MDDSGGILCQISYLKDMLDQVNEDVEANIQVTREIESEIVKCSEIETSLAYRESEVMKIAYMLQFEINGLIPVTSYSIISVKALEEELHIMRMKRDDLVEGSNNKRDGFIALCLDFQREIDKGENDELGALLSDKEFLENEIYILDKKNYALRNSMSAFVEEVLEDLHSFNSALQVQIQSGDWENEQLLKDIDDLKTTLLSTISTNDDLPVLVEIDGGEDATFGEFDDFDVDFLGFLNWVLVKSEVGISDLVDLILGLMSLVWWIFLMGDDDDEMLVLVFFFGGGFCCSLL